MQQPNRRSDIFFVPQHCCAMLAALCCVATEMSWPTIYNLKKYNTKQKSYQFYISLSENEKQKTTIPIVSPYNHSMMFGCFCIGCCRPTFGNLWMNSSVDIDKNYSISPNLYFTCMQGSKLVHSFLIVLHASSWPYCCGVCTVYTVSAEAFGSKMFPCHTNNCHRAHTIQALCGSWSSLSGGRLLRRRVCRECVCGGGVVGGWASALAAPRANCRMFTLRRGTRLIITAGPGHIKGLRKGQTFCWSATVSRPASAHACTYTQKADRTHTRVPTRHLYPHKEHGCSL